MSVYSSSQVARAAGDLEEQVTAFKQYQEYEQQLAEARVYLKETAASDPEMAGGPGAALEAGQC